MLNKTLRFLILASLIFAHGLAMLPVQTAFADCISAHNGDVCPF